MALRAALVFLGITVLLVTGCSTVPEPPPPAPAPLAQAVAQPQPEPGPEPLEWAVRAPVPGVTFRTIGYAPGEFVALGQPEGLYTSKDGVAWQPHPRFPFNSVPFEATDLALGEGRTVAVDALGRAATLSEQRAWGSPVKVSDQPLRAITFAGDRFVAVGDGGVVAISPDGVAWTVQSSSAGVNLSGVAFGNGLFVAVGEGIVLRSKDGIAWEPTYLPGSWRDVAFGQGRFVVVGGDGLATSADGLTWSPQPSGAGPLHGIAMGSDRLVALGPGGKLLIGLPRAEAANLPRDPDPYWRVDLDGDEKYEAAYTIGGRLHIVSGEGKVLYDKVPIQYATDLAVLVNRLTDRPVLQVSSPRACPRTYPATVFLWWDFASRRIVADVPETKLQCGNYRPQGDDRFEGIWRNEELYYHRFIRWDKDRFVEEEIKVDLLSGVTVPNRLSITLRAIAEENVVNGHELFASRDLYESFKARTGPGQWSFNQTEEGAKGSLRLQTLVDARPNGYLTVTYTGGVYMREPLVITGLAWTP